MILIITMMIIITLIVMIIIILITRLLVGAPEADTRQPGVHKVFYIWLFFFIFDPSFFYISIFFFIFVFKCTWWPYIEKTKHNVWLKKNDHNFCWKEKKKRPIPIQSSEVRFVPPVTVGRRVKFLPSVLHFHSFHSKISDFGFLSVSFDFFCMKSHCKP